MEKQQEKTEEKKVELTTQAIDRALQQVQKNWDVLENEDLITDDDWKKAKTIIVKAVTKHIKNKYGI